MYWKPRLTDQSSHIPSLGFTGVDRATGWRPVSDRIYDANGPLGRTANRSVTLQYSTILDVAEGRHNVFGPRVGAGRVSGSWRELPAIYDGRDFDLAPTLDGNLKISGNPQVLRYLSDRGFGPIKMGGEIYFGTSAGVEPVLGELKASTAALTIESNEKRRPDLYVARNGIASLLSALWHDS